SKTTIFIIDIFIVILATAIILYKSRLNNQHAPSTNVLDNKKPTTVITSKDIRAIAGDDMMVTQLDLARAYIELGKKKLAKQILDHVIKHGNPSQQQSARQLMASF
ncbi:MAG: hypothetical protein JO131_04785, partial [Gammaproteobacteria bacterium]|nr:hypothetical protein [Gammaproteobacteria bacterium]